MAWICSKCGESYEGDYCIRCTDETFVPSPCSDCKYWAGRCSHPATFTNKDGKCKGMEPRKE